MDLRTGSQRVYSTNVADGIVMSLASTKSQSVHGFSAKQKEYVVVVGKKSLIEVIDLSTEKTITETIGVGSSLESVRTRATTSTRIVVCASCEMAILFLSWPERTSTCSQCVAFIIANLHVVRISARIGEERVAAKGGSVGLGSLFAARLQ